MKRVAKVVCLAASIALLVSARAAADNECVASSGAKVSAGCSLAIESKTVGQGQATSVGIAITNDVTLTDVEVMLVIREIDPGSYITALSYPPRGRVPGGRLDLATGSLLYTKIANRYDVENGNCKNGFPGGFWTFVPDSYTGPWSSPDGVKFVGNSADPTDPGDPPLLPGADPVTGSLQLLLTANNTPGQFEIDTTCCMPACHTVFVDENGNSIIPEFTKGVITIVACHCPSQGDMDNSGAFDERDVLAVIRVAFVNGTDVKDPECPRTRADVNNSGAVDVQDALYMITTTFLNGPSPINPCGP